jgi:DNA-binding transcriptional LysR family regulator
MDGEPVELRHLRYFVTVAELGSFTKAAQALFIAQPPLSSQVRDLEEEIGAPLLVRHVRGVTLTPAGEEVLREAKEILAHAERLKVNAPRQAGAAKRTLTIGFIASASHFLLPRVLPALRARHRGLVYDLREMLSTEQLAALQIGKIDAALCRPPVRAKALEVAAQFDDPFLLAIPKGHPLARTGDVSLEAAASADFVTFKRDEARAFFDQTLNFCTEAGFSPTIRSEAGTVFGVLNLVAAGVGVAIVPASCASAAGEAIVMRRLVRPVRPGGLVLAKRKVDRDPAVELLGTMMQEAFTALHLVVERKLGH